MKLRFVKEIALSLFILALVWYIAALAPVQGAERTFNSPKQCLRLLSLAHQGNNDVFPIADPSLGGTPLGLFAAMGRSGMDGIVTVSVGAGFTPPLVLTVYSWQKDTVNPAKAGWRRIGANAADYSATFDSHYTQRQFAIGEQTPFLIRADKAVTGDVYVDAPEDPNNTFASQAGYAKF